MGIIGVVVIGYIIYKILVPTVKGSTAPAFHAEQLVDYRLNNVGELQKTLVTDSRKATTLFLKDANFKPPPVFEPQNASKYDTLPEHAKLAVRWVYSYMVVFNKIDLWRVKAVRDRILGYNQTADMVWGMAKGVVDAIVRSKDLLSAALNVVLSAILGVVDVCAKVEEREKQVAQMGVVFLKMTDLLGPPPVGLLHYIETNLSGYVYDKSTDWQVDLPAMLVLCAVKMEQDGYLVGGIEPITKEELFFLQNEGKVSLVGGRCMDWRSFTKQRPEILESDKSPLTGEVNQKKIDEISKYDSQFWAQFRIDGGRFSFQWRQYAFHPSYLLGETTAGGEQFDFYKWYALSKKKTDLPFEYPKKLFDFAFWQTDLKGKNKSGHFACRIGHDPFDHHSGVGSSAIKHSKGIMCTNDNTRYNWLITDPEKGFE